jgi:hypothetical protein
MNGLINISETYQRKIVACLSIIDILEIDFDDIIDKYHDQTFEHTDIKKGELIERLFQSSKLTQMEHDYLAVKCGGLRWFKDRRSGVEYAIDLLIGWISEDALMLWFDETDILAVLSGRDRYREFLNARQISTQPDIEIGTGPNRRKLEYMNDWTGYWGRSNTLDLRDNKYNRLLEECSIFLGISSHDLNAVVMDFNDTDDIGNWIRITSHQPYGGKPAWQLTNVSDHFLPIDRALNSVLEIFR